MRTQLSTYARKSSWRQGLPLLPVGLMLTALVAGSGAPAVEYIRLGRELGQIRSTAHSFDALRQAFAEYGESGPPTHHVRRLESLLGTRFPSSYEPTDFYMACLQASASLDLELFSIVPGIDTDLGLPVGPRVVHERGVSLQARGSLASLTGFLVGLHKAGHPVGVRAFSVDVLESGDGRGDFQIDLGAYYLAEPQFDLLALDTDLP